MGKRTPAKGSARGVYHHPTTWLQGPLWDLLVTKNNHITPSAPKNLHNALVNEPQF